LFSQKSLKDTSKFIFKKFDVFFLRKIIFPDSLFCKPKTMRKRYFAIFILLALFLSLHTKRSDIKIGEKISEQDFEFLMNQLEGNGCYWLSSRREPKGIALSQMDILISPYMISSSYDCQNFASRMLVHLSRENDLNRAVPLLIHHLKYKSPKAQTGNDFFPLRYLAIQALSRIKDPRAVDALLEVIHHTRQCLSTKPNALCSAKISYDAFGQSYDHSKHDEHTQMYAIGVLAEISANRPDVFSLFIAGLKDNSSFFRSSSAYALAKLKSYQSIDSVITLLKQDPDESVRYNAADALGIFGPEAAKAVPELIQFIQQNKKSEPTIYKAVRALAKIGTPEAMNALNNFSKSSDSKISHVAKTTLVALKKGIRDEERPWE
jgi:HEAT repeats/PBS lyase HEAT-like repeat